MKRMNCSRPELHYPGGGGLPRGGQYTIYMPNANVTNIPSRLIIAIPFTAMSVAATMAPRIEIYTILACRVHRPEYTRNNQFSYELNLPHVGGNELITPGPTFGMLADYRSARQDINISVLQGKMHQSTTEDDQNCASDPDVQAAVAKLTAGIYNSTCVP